jgi:molybdopterin molybdotransferase
MEWLEARETVHRLGAGLTGGTETVALSEAVGRTLAAEVRSLTALPGFASSAMDGWAVNGSEPWTLGDPILAGDPPTTTPLAPGTARPIATGACVPAGTQGILRSEKGQLAPAPTSRPGASTCGRAARSADSTRGCWSRVACSRFRGWRWRR